MTVVSAGIPVDPPRVLQAVNFVRRRLVLHHDVDAAARELVAKALSISTNDNVSVVVVALNQESRS